MYILGRLFYKSIENFSLMDFSCKIMTKNRRLILIQRFILKRSDSKAWWINKNINHFLQNSRIKKS